MELTGALLLLSLGFAVGLSGALMPGPLLVYTIKESLKKGRWTGAVVIAGHMLVEVLVFAAIMVGLNEFMSSRSFVVAAGLLGGAAMVYAALKSLSSNTFSLGHETKAGLHHTLAGGVFYTAFNPGFPIWWATAGTRLLMEGMQQMGQTGMLLVFTGHWVADLGWFLMVSMLTAKSSGLLFERGWYKNVRITLSIALLAIGVYFIATAFA